MLHSNMQSRCKEEQKTHTAAAMKEVAEYNFCGFFVEMARQILCQLSH